MPEIDLPEQVLIPMDKIRPNQWNPNEMPSDLFDELVRNFEEFGFVQPIIVRPLSKEEADLSGFDYEIVDGEHRYDGLRLMDVDEAPCIIRVLDSDAAKFQTVKMNRLRGKFNQKRFDSLVRDLMTRFTFDEVAEKMAFTDPSELEALIGRTRDALPTDEMKEEFDKAKEEIRTVDDLAMILNRLFTQFGDTLPYNFMVLDFGGKDHIWVRMQARDYRNILSQVRECMAHGVTFDSVLTRLIVELPVARYITSRRDFLEEVSDEAASRATVVAAMGE
jgi:hypothetical protein